MTAGSDPAPPALSLKGVTVRFDGEAVVNNVSVEIPAGMLVGVVGPNGAGKSTLFNAIMGLQPLAEGRIAVHGQSREAVRGFLAYVPQREQVNWRFPVTVAEVVMLGRTRRIGWLRRPGQKDREAVADALRRVGMWELRRALVARLSGGQRQRVFIARALAQEAHVLLLDEAFSGVDIPAQSALVDILRDLRYEGRTVLLATHDLTRLAERFDAVLCLNHHVCAYGPPETAFTAAVLEELYGAHGVALAGNGG